MILLIAIVNRIGGKMRAANPVACPGGPSRLSGENDDRFFEIRAQKSSKVDKMSSFRPFIGAE